MNVLVVGSGGREHALIWKLAQSPMVSTLYSAPGNPGIGTLARRVPINVTEIEQLCDFAERTQIDLTVVGPEQPLAEGIADAFERRGLKVFGPTRQAAQLEWSKAFAKEFMERHDIPTARYQTFEAAHLADAESCLQHVPLPVVIKADGLAAGKGVVVCDSRALALDTLNAIVGSHAFGDAGRKIVFEEFLRGEEASVFAVCDGRTYVLLAPAQDHKRVLDGDRGKNTGGMGAYAPAPLVTPEILAEVEKRIIVPTLHGMAAEGRPYKGCLYVGLMIGPEGPRVVEYNCRFGDPETQVVLPLFRGDLLALLVAASNGSLSEYLSSGEPTVSEGTAVCVVLASGGYPDAYESGYEIKGLEMLSGMSDIVVFHAGTSGREDTLITAGGRVLGVTATQPSGNLADTIERAYEAVSRISFEKMHFRHDIGAKALVHTTNSLRTGESR